MRHGRLLHELVEKISNSRIGGVCFSRADGPSAQPEPPAIPPHGNSRNRRVRTGGERGPENGNPFFTPRADAVAPPIVDPITGGGLDANFPRWEKRRANDFDASKQHAPRDHAPGKSHCLNYSSNEGRPTHDAEWKCGTHNLLNQSGLH